MSFLLIFIISSPIAYISNLMKYKVFHHILRFWKIPSIESNWGATKGNSLRSIFTTSSMHYGAPEKKPCGAT